MIRLRIIFINVILILLSTSYVTTDPFQAVCSSCTYWDALDVYSNDDAEKLHCILDETNQLGIIYVRWKWISQGFCPYYDRFSRQIHVKPCDAKLGLCPDEDFFSYEAVKYSACIEANPRDILSLNTVIPDLQAITKIIQDIIQNANNNSLPVINVAVSVFILVTMVGLHILGKINLPKNDKKEITPKDVVSGFCVKMKRKRRSKPEKKQENHQLQELV